MHDRFLRGYLTRPLFHLRFHPEVALAFLRADCDRIVHLVRLPTLWRGACLPRAQHRRLNLTAAMVRKLRIEDISVIDGLLPRRFLQ